METKLMTGWLVIYINREKKKKEAIYATTALEKGLTIFNKIPNAACYIYMVRAVTTRIVRSNGVIL